MPKKITFEDTAVRLHVKSVMKETKDKRLYERFYCIYLLLMGETQKNIAKLINRGADTVSNYVQAYCTKGLQGLEPQHSPSRPRQLTEAQKQQLYQTIVEKTPTDVGFPANLPYSLMDLQAISNQVFRTRHP